MRHSCTKFEKVSFIMLLFVSFGVAAQDHHLIKESLSSDHLEWFKGTITNNDGEVLQGLIKYNDKSGILAYQGAHESFVFTSRNVSDFEFYDEARNQQRKFLTLDYNDPKNGAVHPLFFEVLIEFSTFAVLTKVDPVEVDVINQSGARPGIPFRTYTSRKVKTTQRETIYILDHQGNVDAYTKVEDIESDRIFGGSKTDYDMINKHALENQINPDDWKTLLRYAKENDLKLKVKKDLLTILEYYKAEILRE